MAIKKIINVEVKTDKAEKNIEGVGDKVNKETGKIKKGFEGLTGTFDKFTGGAVSKIKSFTSSLGGVSMGFKSIGVAIAASGIGLLITMIAAVTAAFKSSEEGQNKFAKLMGVIGSVVGNLIDVLSDFGEVIIEAIENPQKAWDSFVESMKTGYEFVKNQIIDRFSSAWTLLAGGIESGILKMRIAWNEFTGDSEEAEQLKTQLQEVQTEMIAATEVINQRNQEIINGFNAAIDKVKEFGKEIEEDAKRAQQIADQRANADKRERDLIVARARANRDIAELREKAMQRENYTLEERIKLLEDASKIEENITNREIIAARLRAEAKTAENALSKSTKEDLKEEAELKARVIELETARLTKQKELTSQIAGFREQEKAALEAEIKAKEDAANKDLELNVQRLEAIRTIEEEYRQKREDELAELDSEKLELEQERKLKELEALEANEQQKAEVIAYYDNKIAEEKAKERERELEAERILKQQKLSIVADTFGAIASILGKNSKLAKGFAVGQALINTWQGVTEVWANKTTIPEPWGTIQKIGSTVTVLASGLNAVRQIKNTDNSPGGGGGSASTGEGARGQAPNFNLIGSGGINSIAQSLNQREQQPVKAYVVSKEMTSQQEIDRNVEDTASI